MKHVLLIEDRDAHQFMIKNELEDLKFSVTPYSSLAEIQRDLPALTATPCGIVLDLGIPRDWNDGPTLEAGRDCALFLRSQPNTAKVPIIACTAFSTDPRFAGWADVLGFCAVFKKNVDPLETLRRAVRQFFV
jgi:CheY-like chemotaxis protein